MREELGTTKRIVCAVVAFVAATVTLVNVAFCVKDTYFYSIDDLPDGTLVREDKNWDLFLSEHYVLRIYQVDKNQHYPSAVRVELYNTHTKDKKNIYWQTETQSTVISWDEENKYKVNINDVWLDVRTDTYDCRDQKVIEK